MKIIRSRSNCQYQHIKQLSESSRMRRLKQQTILEGIHLCEAYLNTQGIPLYALVGRSALQHAQVQELLSMVQDQRVILLEDHLFDHLSQLENGVRILLVVDVPSTQMPPILTSPCVLLDRIQDPGNLGSILRSAAAAGVTQIVCSPGTVGAWSPKVLRAGMGAHFLLNLYEDCELTQALAQINHPIFAMSAHAEHNLFETQVSQACWLFGNEGQGISAPLLKQCRALKIPQVGAIESLNVAAAAAICLFEQLRQRSAYKA